VVISGCFMDQSCIYSNLKTTEMLSHTHVFLVMLAHAFAVRRMGIVRVFATAVSLSDLEGPLFQYCSKIENHTSPFSEHSIFSSSSPPRRFAPRHTQGDFVGAAAFWSGELALLDIECCRRCVLMDSCFTLPNFCGSVLC